MTQKNFLPEHKLDIIGALLLIAGAFVPSMAVGFCFITYDLITGYDTVNSDYTLVIANTIMWVGAIWTFDYFSYRPQTGKKLNFDLSSRDLSTYIIIFGMMIGMMFIGETITSLIPITGPIFGPLYDSFSRLMEQMTSDTSTMILMVVILAPLFEEIVFRGIIQKGMINNGFNPTNAIIISSIIFGLVHANPWQFVGAGLLGYVLGLVYHKTNSLLLPILLHAFNNLTSVITTEYFKIESFGEIFNVSQWVIFGIGIVLFTIFHQLFLKKYPSKL